MRPLLPGLLILLFAAGNAPAEPVKVWITLKDKGSVTKASRTERAYEDAPVHAPYLQQLRGAGFAVTVTLKWQNRVSGWAEPAALPTLAALPFVAGIEELPRKAPGAPLPKVSSGLPLAKSAGLYGIFDSVFYKTGVTELRDTLLARGLRPGEGIRIAQLDEDFHLGHTAFDSLFADNRIVDQWDFVSNDAQSVDRLIASSHGGTVLSPMAANLPGFSVGIAPHARYLLYRTENGVFEGYVEEDYLAAGLERAVDSGAQVINVSLGYRYDFLSDGQTPYRSMDGRTRPASLAALGAARRGALVIVAMGNEGGMRPDSNGGPLTPTITSPADADSILSVGMVSRTMAWCAYSSTGPSFDGRLKPEISSAGLGAGCTMLVVDPATPAGAHDVSGTSVGAPVITGIAALLRQLHPDSGAAPVSSQKIRRAIMATGRRADSANNSVGNGLVRAGQAHCALLRDSLVQTPCASPIPSVGVKGVLVWRGGNIRTMTWPTSLDLSRVRMWDLQGRAFPLQGGLNEDGEVQLQSRRRLAPGTFILRIPRVPEDPEP